MFVICFEETFVNKSAFIAFLIASASILAACNTVQGLGKDIEKGGQAIERAATR